jgi:hypothetical protein
VDGTPATTAKMLKTNEAVIPVCHYRLGSFMAKVGGDDPTVEATEASPHCFAATVCTRPALPHWHYTYSRVAAGDQAQAAQRGELICCQSDGR